MAKKIVVVDDDQGTLRLVQSLLESKGYEVVALDYPKNAIKVIKTEQPDMVLLDIIMPYKDGYRLCEEVKELFKDMPVMVFTSQPYEKDLIGDAYKDFGADDFITKPFETEVFLEKVEKLINK